MKFWSFFAFFFQFDLYVGRLIRGLTYIRVYTVIYKITKLYFK
jgi:hypothetical protein